MHDVTNTVCLHHRFTKTMQFCWDTAILFGHLGNGALRHTFGAGELERWLGYGPVTEVD